MSSTGTHVTKPKRRLSRAASTGSQAPSSPVNIPANVVHSTSSAVAISPSSHPNESTSTYFSTSPTPLHAIPGSGSSTYVSTGTTSAHSTHGAAPAFSPTYPVSKDRTIQGQRGLAAGERRDAKRPSFGAQFAPVGEEKERKNGSGILYDGSSEESGGSARNSGDASAGMDMGGIRSREKEQLHLGYLPPPGLDTSGATLEGSKTSSPKLFGVELKWISLVTLALQNAFLAIIMHQSRISPSATPYSPAAAVLMNELLKGSISMVIALKRVDTEMLKTENHSLSPSPRHEESMSPIATKPKTRFPMTSGRGGIGRAGIPTNRSSTGPTPASVLSSVQEWVVPLTKADRWARLALDIFSTDCWKLGIPAVLYVIQNNLQYVASSNLDVATFQVTYQMKILTTALFSVILLRKRLSSSKWLALLLLAVGVGIVQIQSGNAGHGSPPAGKPSPSAVIEAAHEHMAGSLRSEAPEVPTHTSDLPVVGKVHEMHPLRGFAAVCAACLTSGLAGVYFEMVLKGSKADLWTRNVQLSLFSLIPALIPVLFGKSEASGSGGLFSLLMEPFTTFSIWAWGTVLTQVFGGLITALVIKYSDNILKGFATSISIVLSFLASVGLFNYPITPAFILGSMVVLSATWMYNQPAPASGSSSSGIVPGLPGKVNRQGVATMGSPVSPNAPIIGETPKPSRTSSVVSLLGLTSGSNSRTSTPGLHQSMQFTPGDYLVNHSQFRSPSPAPNQGFFTAPPSPHIHTPSLSSSHSSSSNLYDQSLAFTKSNGVAQGGNVTARATSSPIKDRRQQSVRPALELDTSGKTARKG